MKDYVWVPQSVGEWLCEVWGEIHPGEQAPTLVYRGRQARVPATAKLLRYCEQEVDLYSGPGVDPEYRSRSRTYRVVVQRLRDALNGEG